MWQNLFVTNAFTRWQHKYRPVSKTKVLHHYIEYYIRTMVSVFSHKLTTKYQLGRARLIQYIPHKHFWLPWRDPWGDSTPGGTPPGDRHQNVRCSIRVRSGSLCKISAKSIQQFQRKCARNRQTDRLTNTQTTNLLNIPHYHGRDINMQNSTVEWELSKYWHTSHHGIDVSWILWTPKNESIIVHTTCVLKSAYITTNVIFVTGINTKNNLIIC